MGLFLSKSVPQLMNIRITLTAYLMAMEKKKKVLPDVLLISELVMAVGTLGSP